MTGPRALPPHPSRGIPLPSRTRAIVKANKARRRREAFGLAGAVFGIITINLVILAATVFLIAAAVLFAFGL